MKVSFLSCLYSQYVQNKWNNGKEVPRLDLTSLTTPGQQIHKFDHTRTANPCDWIPCRRAALPLVDCPYSLVYLHLPVVEGLIFCVSATPHLGTSFPLFHDTGLVFVSRANTASATGMFQNHINFYNALYVIVHRYKILCHDMFVKYDMYRHQIKFV